MKARQSVARSAQCSSVAQRQSIRLLTGGLLVRIQPEEPISAQRNLVICDLPWGDRLIELNATGLSVEPRKRRFTIPCESVTHVCGIHLPPDANPIGQAVRVGLARSVLILPSGAVNFPNCEGSAMANTSSQGRVEGWIVENELPRLFTGKSFSKRKVRLAWGGDFEFDAVSSDSEIIGCVSTSCSRTASGRAAVGKFHKLKADALYLLSTALEHRRVMVFTDEGMKAHFERERARGRFPPPEAIELVLVALPEALACELRAAARSASIEVSPRA